MPYKSEVIKTSTGIESQKYTLRWGNNVVAVHTQGGIFELYHNNQPVTAQWPLETQLVVQRQQKLATSIISLVEMAYPGNANIYREVSIEAGSTDNVTSFLDVVRIENTGELPYQAAPGWHTYFHALLSEVVVPHLWSSNNAPSEYDDNLYDGVKAREINQVAALNRRILVVPLENIGNQIIYRANKTGLKTKRDAAVENWWTAGDGTFPDKHWVVEPGNTVKMAFRIIVVDGEAIPPDIQEHIDAVNNKFAEI